MNGINSQAWERGWQITRKRYVYVDEQRALEIISSCGPISAKALRGLLDISESTCERLVRRLKVKKLIMQKEFRGEYYVAKNE